MFAAPPHTNLRTPVALLLGLALACSSCGRALPTAPSDGAAAGLGRTATPFRAQGSDDAAVVTLSPGASGDEISSDFGATLLAGSAPSFARLVPGAGETCDQLVGRLALDPRVVTVERDDVLETAETRQESYASDDGNGALQTLLAGFDQAGKNIAI